MVRLLNTVAFRLAMGYGALMIGAVAVISAVVFVGTVGVLNREIDAKILMISERLSGQFEDRRDTGVKEKIQQLLTDDVDQDTEDYLLLGPAGEWMAGNLSEWHGPFDRLTDLTVSRYGRKSFSRVFARELPDGSILVVGRDMQDIEAIRQLVFRALLVGAVITVVLAIGGAIAFRWQLERRVAAIRRTVQEIEAGDLSRRIPVLDADDEFTRLNRDLNHMLDQIQHLMDGVRDISNAIAHDLRTPLGRIRGLLDGSLHPSTTREKFTETTMAAIRGIDELINIFDKLLQIAEAESGTRRQSFHLVALNQVVTDVVELYDAAAEAKGVHLVANIEGEPATMGDKDLLASATANLIDNALKYAGNQSTVRVQAGQDGNTVSIVVQDNGPGIPASERVKVLTRFYRCDRSRSLPGNGLGLPIVTAISHLHNGAFFLEDASPGLVARIVLPRAHWAAPPDSNMVVPASVEEATT